MIGFEQEVYTANEADGSVTVCVVVLDGTVSSSATTLLMFSAVEDTAQGLNTELAMTFVTSE